MSTLTIENLTFNYEHHRVSITPPSVLIIPGCLLSWVRMVSANQRSSILSVASLKPIPVNVTVFQRLRI